MPSRAASNIRRSSTRALGPYGDDTFVVVEKWESAAHLKAHAKAAHTLEYQAKVKDLIESRTIHVLSPA